MGYDPNNPMEGRITDLGPPHYSKFLPPVIANNKGKWLYHEIKQPGVLVHVSETGDECYTVRVASARLISIELIEQIKAWGQGIYLMPAFNHYDLAADIIEGIQ